MRLLSTLRHRDRLLVQQKKLDTITLFTKIFHGCITLFTHRHFELCFSLVKIFDQNRQTEIKDFAATVL